LGVIKKIMIRRAIIISIKGTKLTNSEKKIIIKGKPWGIILFKRNLASFRQAKKLIDSIKNLMKDNKYPILIDEEGGSVSRLSNFLDNKVYSQEFFGNIFKTNKSLCCNLYTNYISSMSAIFRSLGVNINTSPVLDLSKKITHKVIGSRSYSNNTNVVKKLGKLCVKTYLKNKIATVIKHIPGHGSATSDSHLKLPIVATKKETLSKYDFSCFKETNSFFAMTAHIVYSDIDPKLVSTHSKIIIKKIIRQEIKFRGILISDDISMKALKYDLVQNATMSLNAGCNLVLYCAGNIKESSKLLKKIPFIDAFTIKKTSEFYNFLS